MDWLLKARRIWHPLAVVCGLTLLAGCATQDIRANPHETGKIDFQAPFSRVYAGLAYSARTCFPRRGTNVDHYFTTATELEPGKLGRIEIIHGTMMGDNSFVSLDVRATPTGTVVEYYISNIFFSMLDNSSSFRPIALAWAEADTRKCG